uniref:Pacifastin domain-containing protein n=1 Tax=Bombyx mori TaxID=7091 RepID=A0A8R2HRG8_BOMMO|nr:uncharacterized protein LOC110384732 [Bombyx mori]
MEDNSESHTVEQIAIICSQCFCPRNGYINERYCTKNCSSKTRRIMFEKFLRDDNHAVVQVFNQQKGSSMGTCRSNYFYRDQNQTCLCPDNGKINKELCLFITEQTKENDTNATGPGTKTGEIDFDINCESNTFITYDCNICYCNKTGKLDPKWCTYDDCETKKNLQESQKTKPAHLEPNDYSCNKSGNLSLESCTAHNGSNITTAQDFGVHDPSLPSPNATCEPGSLTKVRCNLCICPKSGLEIDRVCTNNNCSENIEETAKANNYDEIHCEPLAYYTVDCNVCFCPKEGIKNLAKCTNNICEKRYLRSSSCNPGELFSESCNICICPRNGDLLGRVCTDRDCNDHVARSMLFQLSQGLLPELNETHSLDICFPGEEFVVGCNLCVCPDMGLRAYSICTPMFCDERNHAIQVSSTFNCSISKTKLSLE